MILSIKRIFNDFSQEIGF